MIGPTRVERSTAEADLVAMRAFPRAEMPKLLADLMAAARPVQQEQVEVVSRQKTPTSQHTDFRKAALSCCAAFLKSMC